MKLVGFIISFSLMGYLHWILELPILLSALIVLLFIIPPVSFYTNLALSFIYMYVSIGIHLYTIIFAFAISWWKGILTIFLPGISQIYWFFAESSTKGYKNSIFCIIMLIYLFGLIVTYIFPIFISTVIKKNP